ncbi:hypothetical protein K070079E91_56360 [Eisenbergiella porci]
MRFYGLFLFSEEFQKGIWDVAHQLPGLSGAGGQAGISILGTFDIFCHKKLTGFILLHGQSLCYNRE